MEPRRKKKRNRVRNTLPGKGRQLTDEEKKPNTIRSNAELVSAQKKHQDDVALGLQHLIRPMMKAKAIRSVQELASRIGVCRQFLSNCFAGEQLLSPVLFNSLCTVLEPAPTDLATLRAIYVDAAVGKKLLNLTLTDFEKYYNPDRQRRLTSWLLALAFPKISESQDKVDDTEATLNDNKPSSS
jgi:hypothetical protein